jgi:hypothetical protein
VALREEYLEKRRNPDLLLCSRFAVPLGEGPLEELICARILSVWIYNNTGKSVFAATLFHTMSNLSWALFPNYGTHYNPMVTSLITLLAVGFVLLRSEPKTFTRNRFISTRPI